MILAALVVASLLAACGMFGTRESSRYPESCADFELSPTRCQAIVAWALEQLGSARPVASVDLLGDPGCGPVQNPAVSCVRTMAFVVRVRLNFADGTNAETSVFCGVGGQHSILCTETPEIQLSLPSSWGYWDIPVGSTPVPTADAEAASNGLSLIVENLSIPIDHVGRYEIDVGRAVLPNGILTEARFGLADPKTQAVAVREEGVRLEIESLLPDRPTFDGSFAHGWWPGVEPVRVVLSFEVTRFDKGASLEVIDLVVR